MAHYLITGGAGFIGSHLAERLVKEGHRVRILDDFSTGNLRNLEDVEGRVEILRGSVVEKGNLPACMDGIDYVLHQAALPSVARSVENPARSLQVNSLGTLHILEAALGAKVKRVIVASSSSVYGDNRRLPKEEAMMPMPISPYAASKLAAEHMATVFYRVHGLETIALRYFNVFGPRQDPGSLYAAVIPKFIAAMSQGQPPQIYGDGTQSRDFTYVDNVVEANLLACKAPAKACGVAYNVATHGRVSLLKLVQDLNAIFKTRIQPVFAAERPGDVKHSQADIARAARFLGYRPKISFQEGLTRTVLSNRALPRRKAALHV